MLVQVMVLVFVLPSTSNGTCVHAAAASGRGTSLLFNVHGYYIDLGAATRKYSYKCELHVWF